VSTLSAIVSQERKYEQNHTMYFDIHASLLGHIPTSCAYPLQWINRPRLIFYQDEKTMYNQPPVLKNILTYS
jgi:hypothetical protein